MKMPQFKIRDNWLGRPLLNRATFESPEETFTGPIGSRLYSEELFSIIYKQECKRSERSGKPFLLMLINVTCLHTMNSQRFIDPIEAHLLESTRGSDWKGWFQNGKVIGIVFTEFQANMETLLRKRLENRFRSIIGHGPAGMVSLSIYRVIGTERKIVATDGNELSRVDATDLHLEAPSSRRKRVVDIFGALFGLFLFMPVIIIVAALVKATSRGPVFFRQERVGKDGKPFHMLKFRSMFVNNDDSIHREYVSKLIKGEVAGETASDGQKIFKLTNDPRITPIGRFIRKTSLDELPQFFNVLKGEMSLVGPRPALAYEVSQYDVWHCRRVTAKPGITGAWQVEGRSLTTFDGMVRMDIRYIERWSLLLDILLIVKTPFSLLTAKGAC